MTRWGEMREDNWPHKEVVTVASRMSRGSEEGRSTLGGRCHLGGELKHIGQWASGSRTDWTHFYLRFINRLLLPGLGVVCRYNKKHHTKQAQTHPKGTQEGQSYGCSWGVQQGECEWVWKTGWSGSGTHLWFYPGGSWGVAESVWEGREGLSDFRMENGLCGKGSLAAHSGGVGSCGEGRVGGVQGKTQMRGSAGTTQRPWHQWGKGEGRRGTMVT